MIEPIRVKRKKTARYMAEKLGCNPRTVRRYMAQTRAEYEANSDARAKPWEAMGISRRTWYYKGKPTPQSQGEAA